MKNFLSACAIGASLFIPSAVATACNAPRNYTYDCATQTCKGGVVGTGNCLYNTEENGYLSFDCAGNSSKVEGSAPGVLPTAQEVKDHECTNPLTGVTNMDDYICILLEVDGKIKLASATASSSDQNNYAFSTAFPCSVTPTPTSSPTPPPTLPPTPPPTLPPTPSPTLPPTPSPTSAPTSSPTPSPISSTTPSPTSSPIPSLTPSPTSSPISSTTSSPTAAPTSANTTKAPEPTSTSTTSAATTAAPEPTSAPTSSPTTPFVSYEFVFTEAVDFNTTEFKERVAEYTNTAAGVANEDKVTADHVQTYASNSIGRRLMGRSLATTNATKVGSTVDTSSFNNTQNWAAAYNNAATFTYNNNTANATTTGSSTWTATPTSSPTNPPTTTTNPPTAKSGTSTLGTSPLFALASAISLALLM